MTSLDINLLWVSKCAYPAKYVIKKNHHDYYQIVFILSGEGKITAGDRMYHAGMNQAFIFKPNVEHKIEVSKQKSLNITELKFYCNSVTTENTVYQLAPCITDVGPSLRAAFIAFVDEIKTQDDYTQPIIDALLAQLIYSWKRFSEKEDGYLSQSIETKPVCIHKDNKENSETCKDALEKAVQYIRQNYSQEIKLNVLAEIAFLSPIYFCSVFKDRYGVSPIQYLQDIRCENAKKLLTDTSDTITVIAERVGFQSINYFSRFFKAHVGITPNEFRRRNRDFFIKDYQGNITDYS